MERRSKNVKNDIATVSNEDLRDIISLELCHLRIFTVIDIQDRRVTNTGVIENPAGKLTYEKGFFIAKKLADSVWRR